MYSWLYILKVVGVHELSGTKTQCCLTTFAKIPWVSRSSTRWCLHMEPCDCTSETLLVYLFLGIGFVFFVFFFSISELPDFLSTLYSKYLFLSSSAIIRFFTFWPKSSLDVGFSVVILKKTSKNPAKDRTAE